MNIKKIFHKSEVISLFNNTLVLFFILSTTKSQNIYYDATNT